MALSGDGFKIEVKADLNTNQATQQFNTWVKKMDASKINTIKARFQIDGKNFERQLEVYKDKMGNLVGTEVVREFNKNWTRVENIVSTNVSAVVDNLKRAEEEENNLVRAHQKLSHETKRCSNAFSDFASTFGKMVKFNTINMIYDGVINTFEDAIKVTKEFNDATTELRKVSELSGESLRKYAQDLSAYGQEVGRSMTDMVNSAVIFKRTGATDEEAKELAKISEMYRNVADSEISSAEASSFLVSQMKAFNMTAEESIHIIDAVNKTANEHATSTDDLQKALTKSASALATAGNSYEQTIALIESGVAVMQGQAGTVGNGLRTIAINVANLATKNEELVVANGKLTVSLKESNGEIRSTYDILADLAKGWDKLTRAEQNEVAVSLAGKQIIPLSCSLKTYLIARTFLQHYNYNIRMKYA